MSHDVFISYSTEDLKIVEATSGFLEKNNIKCWYAKRDLRPGSLWVSDIYSNIKQSKILVLILTPNSCTSDEVDSEIFYTTYTLPHYSSISVPIIPYKLGDFVPSERMLIRLKDVHGINADVALNNNDLSLLLDSVREKIGTNITPTEIKSQNKILYRLFIRSEQDGSISIWVVEGINDINKQKREYESIVSPMGGVILDISLISKDGVTEMSDGFKELVLKSGNIELLNNLKKIDKETIDYVLTNLVDKPLEINYSKKLGKLHLNQQESQYRELLPLNLKLIPNPDMILTGGDFSSITAQLYVNGVPYLKQDIAIDFFLDNDTFGFLPTVKNALTSSNGQAQIILTSKEYPGAMTVFAEAMINGKLLRNKVIVTSCTWGSIVGKVYDINRNGIPNATVTLWRSRYNEEKNVFERITLCRTPENPQRSHPMETHIGNYTFYRIPTGIYQISAEKADASGNNRIGFTL